MMSEALDIPFDKLDKQLERMSELTDMLFRTTDQRLVGLEREARQPRFAMEADVRPDTKNLKRTNDAAADRAKHGDKSSFAQVDYDPMCLSSFGDDSTEPPALPCRNDALINKG